MTITDQTATTATFTIPAGIVEIRPSTHSPAFYRVTAHLGDGARWSFSVNAGTLRAATMRARTGLMQRGYASE